MSHPEPLSQWMETVSSMLPKLSRPQAKVLAYWSYGVVLARSCGITLVCAALALQVDSTEQKGAWKPHWIKLLEKLVESAPEHWTVIVLSDRGLYAPWLSSTACGLGSKAGLKTLNAAAGVGIRPRWWILSALGACG